MSAWFYLPAKVFADAPLFPRALYLDVGLIHSPATACCLFPLAGDRFEQGKKRIAQRLIDEWSTEMYLSSIISSSCPQLSG
jgi:hypothetical protein